MTLTSVPVFAQETTQDPSAVQLPASPEPWPAEPDVGPAVSPIKKGYPAPFTGVLLSPQAVAIVTVEIEHISDKIKIEVDKAVADNDAKWTYKLNEQKIKFDADQKVLMAQLDASKSENKILYERLDKVEKSQPDLMLWVGGGFVAGILTTVLTTYAVTQASK